VPPIPNGAAVANSWANAVRLSRLWKNAPRTLQASLRIPGAELSAAVADLKTLGRVENESQAGEEVTQQHADLVARLKNSRETKQRFRTILEQQTGTSRRRPQGRARDCARGDIERMESEQKALEHRVDFATIDLQIAEECKAQLQIVPPSTSTRLGKDAVGGYRNMADGLSAWRYFCFRLDQVGCYGPPRCFFRRA
jgi:hypothetical protein